MSKQPETAAAPREAAWPELHARIEIFGPWYERWLPSIVEDHDDAGLQIAVPNAPGTIVPVVGRPGETMTLNWVSERGAAEVEARIVEVARNTLASWIVEPLGVPVVRQRRSYVRAEVHLPLSIVAHLGETPRRGWAINLSEGGVRCVTPSGEIDDTVRPLVELEIEGETVMAQAEILRLETDRDGYTHVALKFVNLHHRDADRIRRFVFGAQLRLPARQR